jgi:glutathione S-transferase
MTTLPLTVYGVNQSFFTRKVTGYLDYKQLPWSLRRGLGLSTDVRAGGWDGGLPAVIDADGAVIWDSTSVILHLEHHHPDRAVLPDDPVHRFLMHVLEDFNDEWFYRLAVGSRWLYEENRSHGSWDLARDGAHEVPMPVATIRQTVADTMTGSLARLGATPETIDPLIDESFKPWLSLMSDHVGEYGYLFGGRPSLADFAFYGGNAAHFVNDPLCWQWVDELGPEVAKHTFRLTEPDNEEFGAWLPPGEVPDSLVALLREAGRHYLPWMAAATVDGGAPVSFDDGSSIEIAATDFLVEARGVMLARYAQARSPAIDEALEAAGIIGYYADHVGQATAVPDPAPPPRPADNRPYPAGP